MWVRNKYMGPGGGLYTGPGGGLYTGPDDTPFMINWPPISVFVAELRKRGYHYQASILAKYHGL